METKNKSKITAKQIGGLLFGIHEHIEHKNGKSNIIYYEKDIIKLLVKLGFPKPIWGESIDIDEFDVSKKNKFS